MLTKQPPREFWRTTGRFCILLLAAMISRLNMTAREEETLGAARPQTCARAVTVLDPQLAK